MHGEAQDCVKVRDCGVFPLLVAVPGSGSGSAHVACVSGCDLRCVSPDLLFLDPGKRKPPPRSKKRSKCSKLVFQACGSETDAPGFVPCAVSSTVKVETALQVVTRTPQETERLRAKPVVMQNPPLQLLHLWRHQ